MTRGKQRLNRTPGDPDAPVGFYAEADRNAAEPLFWDVDRSLGKELLDSLPRFL
jgi:hypothetical protein